jgi:hypothetical protein
MRGVPVSADYDLAVVGSGFATCDSCFDARAARLLQMNLQQTVLAPVECGACR